MKKIVFPVFLIAAGALFPIAAFAGPENYPPGAFDFLIYVWVIFILLEVVVMAGLVWRWLNSRAQRPSNQVDYIVIPFAGLMSVLHGFMLWSFVNAPVHAPPDVTLDNFSIPLATTLLIISALATFVPRSWLAKFPAKKTKK